MANEDRPVTNKELDAALGAALSAAISGLRAWIAERLEAQETRLLTAFHRYAEVNHARMQKVEAEQHVDGDRLTKLEERVRALEERLDFPRQSH